MLGSCSRRFLLLLMMCAGLAGCKEVLYSELTETDANAMVAHLDAAGISASRKADKDGIYAILVQSADIPGAITVLNNEGLPRKSFQSIGTIFNAEGIVGTPFEERARFIYAMNEELSRTLSAIHGVTTARVHIMLPETQRFAQDAPISRASVAIHYEDGFAAQQHVPTIKTLVSHSVQNLEYDNVAVALFAAETLQVSRTDQDAAAQGGPSLASSVDFSGIPNKFLLIVAAIASVLLTLAGLLRFVLRVRVEQ